MSTSTQTFFDIIDTFSFIHILSVAKLYPRSNLNLLFLATFWRPTWGKCNSDKGLLKLDWTSMKLRGDYESSCVIMLQISNGDNTWLSCYVDSVPFTSNSYRFNIVHVRVCFVFLPVIVHFEGIKYLYIAA